MKTELERCKEALAVARHAMAILANVQPGESPFQLITAYQKDIDTILNPPPEMEEVELVSWAIIAPSGFIETTSTNEGLQRDQVGNPNSPFYGYQVVPLTGTIKRPKKQPVERSVTAVGVKFDSGDCGTSIWPHGANLTGDATVWSNLHGKTGTLTFTWTEEP